MRIGTAACLASIGRARCDTPLEVIVVDDASAEEPPEPLEASSPAGEPADKAPPRSAMMWILIAVAVVTGLVYLLFNWHG